MLQMLVFTLREGIEAFLIVAIAAAYLTKTGRAALLPAVWWGTGVAILLSLVLGVFLAEVAVQPIWEAVLALVAAAFVLSMVVYMLKHAKQLRGEMGARLEAAAQSAGGAAWAGVFLVVLLMITREGMEMAFIAATLARQAESISLFWGALVGIALSASLAWAWSHCSCASTHSTKPPKRTCCRSTTRIGTSRPNLTALRESTAPYFPTLW